MDISRITSQHEGALEIVNSLERLVGGTKYLLLHSTPIINIILLKAMLAWERESEKGLELQFTNFKVSLKKDDEESIHWDCISQTFEEFKVSSLNEKRKNKKCDCFGDDPTKPTKCHCLKVEHIDKRSTLSNEAISLLLARHVFNRRVLNLLGLPLPTRQSVYSLSHSLTEHC